MGTTRIEWATDVWNPVTGCTRVDRGCAHCYAARMAPRLAGRCGYPVDDPFRVTLHPEKLSEPLRWRKPRVVFVDSMGDLFHRDVPDWFIGAAFETMGRASWHVFIVLTKRIERSAQWAGAVDSDPWHHARTQEPRPLPGPGRETIGMSVSFRAWPLPNVILGASAHDGASFNRRAAVLRTIPAACRAMSLEPCVGPVGTLDLNGIGWVIVGGESGPGAAPLHPDWVCDVRDQCAAAGVPFLFKQWGEWAPCHFEDPGVPVFDEDIDCDAGGAPAYNWTPEIPVTTWRGREWSLRIGKHRAGRDLGGWTHDGYPDVIRRLRGEG